MKAVYHKRSSPTTASSTRTATSSPGRGLVLLRCGETLVGPTICEDIWQPGPPATDLALAGAHVVANVSASPFHVGKGAEREEMLATRARDNACWIAYVNAVGAQDELIFDGHSLVLDEEGEIVARGPVLRGGAAARRHRPATAVARRLRDARRRALARARREIPDPPVVDLPTAGRRATGASSPVVAPAPRGARGDAARDRARAARLRGEERLLATWCSASRAASTRRSRAALAAEALGPEHVVCVSMPSRFSSAGDAGRRPARRREHRQPATWSCRSSRSSRRSARPSRRRLRGHGARRRGGERPGARPRPPPDGALEQVRLARRSRRATRASSRSATRRSTATWPVGSRC